MSSAIVVGDAVYLVDCGDGVGKRLQQALEPRTTSGVMDHLRALFLTHLHSDHVVDYPNILLYGWWSGLEQLPSPLQVFGPGRRGQMEPIFALPGGQQRSVPTISSENPTPGTVDMTNYLYQAFATDLNDRMRDNGRRDLRTLIQINDIALPNVAGFKTPNETPAPDMEPFKIYEDDRLRVSATLVNHAPVWPAFAFRFDSDDGSIVFSGDTCRCDNLIRLAKNADILVHEVIVTSWIDQILPEPRTQRDEAARRHLLSAHTPVEEVGKIATEASVACLVLSHLVPGNARAEQFDAVKKDFKGKLIIGEDLLQVGVG